MGRNILFITTDQQRYDSLGCNGGTIARTPVVDGLAADGHQLPARRTTRTRCACRRARRCSPASTCARTAWSRTASRCPHDAPSVAAYLPSRPATAPRCSARRTSSPASTRDTQWPENAMAQRGRHRPVPRVRARRARRCTSPTVGERPLAALRHVARRARTPSTSHGFAAAARGRAAAATPARPRRKHNPIPRELVPHRLGRRPHDRVPRLAAPTTTTGSCWMSFPDPHHPWDPPASELRPGRLARPRPAARPSRVATRRSARCSPQKPAHWLALVRGHVRQPRGRTRRASCPRRLTARPDPRDQRDDPRDERADRRGVRARARRASPRAGWDDDTDVFFTTDHGELQGDYGLLFKGPFHTDALMRLPLVWRPAPSAGVDAGRRDRAGRAARPRADVLRDRRRRAARVDAGRAAADGRRRAGPRAGAVRVGQPVPRLRHAPALDLPRRLAVHRVRAVAPSGGPTGSRRCSATACCSSGRRSSTSRPRPGPAASPSPPASCTTWSTTPTSGTTGGTTPRAGPCGTTSSPTCTPACPPRSATSTWSAPA